MGDLEFPHRMLAAGEEPLGDRVNVYQKMDLITKILGVLEEEERAFLRASTLGKLLEIPTKPAWSGSFGLFLLSRQLDVDKENEIWVLFGGIPVRFSLREFKIVTGLPCGKFPPTEKKKRKGTAGVKTPYYGTLFGLEEDVTVERVIAILKRKSVGDMQMRLRYACLALVDGILLPTTHYPKIRVVKDHAEMVENLDFFLSYPWGRVSFEMIMKSIKERELCQLATSNVAVQGFVYALQLVILEAVPALLVGPPNAGPVSADSDFEDDLEVVSLVSLDLINARKLHDSCKVHVDPIICPEFEFDYAEEDLSWSDEENDPKVDNMIRLAKEGFKFKNTMFTGGCKVSELVLQMEQKNVSKGKYVKAKKGQTKVSRRRRRKTDDEDWAEVATEESNISEMLDLKLFKLMDVLEERIATMMNDKLEANKKDIIDGVIKWASEHAIIQDANNVPSTQHIAVNVNDNLSVGKEQPQRVNRNEDNIVTSAAPVSARNTDSENLGRHLSSVVEIAAFYAGDNDKVAGGDDDDNLRSDRVEDFEIFGAEERSGITMTKVVTTMKRKKKAMDQTAAETSGVDESGGDLEPGVTEQQLASLGQSYFFTHSRLAQGRAPPPPDLVITPSN